MTHRDKKLTELARDQSCVACGVLDGTVVWAHSNLSEHGKGMGHKAHDCMGMFLCYRCHGKLDQGKELSKEDRRELIYRWICLTHIRLWATGMVRVV